MYTSENGNEYASEHNEQASEQKTINASKYASTNCKPRRGTAVLPPGWYFSTFSIGRRHAIYQCQKRDAGRRNKHGTWSRGAYGCGVCDLLHIPLHRGKQYWNLVKLKVELRTSTREDTNCSRNNTEYRGISSSAARG